MPYTRTKSKPSTPLGSSLNADIGVTVRVHIAACRARLPLAPSGHHVNWLCILLVIALGSDDVILAVLEIPSVVGPE